MANENYRHLLGHSFEKNDKLLCFLGRKCACGFIENEKSGSKTKSLDKFYSLLFADRKLPDIGIRLNRQAKALG